MEILLLLLIIFIFFPLLRVIFAVGKTAHSFKKAYDRQAKQYRQAQQQHTETEEKKGRKERLRTFFKKASEDVEFEEIKAERNTATADINTASSGESRISDAHYEDIK